MKKKKKKPAPKTRKGVYPKKTSSRGKPMRRFVVIQGGKGSIPPSKAEISHLKEDNFSSVSDNDRDEIVQMIGFGWTDDQILHMLPHVERGSITAFRAHVTRGTYEQGITHGTARKRGATR